MSNTGRTKVAIIGSGNIGTDLMIKVMRLSETLEMAAMVGIDPGSDGLARAARMKMPTTADGVDGLIAMDGFEDIGIIFDATSAKAHVANAERLAPYGKRLVDLTPAAIGPYVVPPVNLDHHLRDDAANVNMITCGGQATIPMVYAVSRVAPVPYAEIVASVSSASAGPGTRANIDEFTRTTAAGVETIGGAERGKAIIILNPADPPMIMRDTIFCAVAPDADRDAISQSVFDMAKAVQEYVPGYRLLQDPQFDDASAATLNRTKVSIFVEVEGAGDYLPPFAGNLDIMTAAATQVGESIAKAMTR